MAQFQLSAFADEAGDRIEDQIAALKRNGIFCIEPRSVHGAVIDKSEEELFTIRRALDDAGITVPSFGSPIGKAPVTCDIDEYMQTFSKALRVCSILGAERMRVFSFFVPRPELKRYRGEVVSRLRRMVDEAGAAGITLCHENESAIYGQDPEEVADLLQSVPGLRGVFDAANYIRNGKEPHEGFRATVPALEYLHVKDAKTSDGTIVPAGEGDGQYPEVLRQLDRMTDRTVLLTLEPHLFRFSAYRQIDRMEMKTEHTYQNADEAFDAAAGALRQMLRDLGFREGEKGVWRK